MTGGDGRDPEVVAEQEAIQKGERSVGELMARVDEADVPAIVANLNGAERAIAIGDWRNWGRGRQREPDGAWRIWLIMAGRGFGKTRAGAEWVRMIAKRRGLLRIALVGATMAEARAVMVEGESGLLAVTARDDEEPIWEPSLGRLRWPSGTWAQLYSAAEPDSLRGPGHDYAWADEIAKWDKGEAAWDNLMMTLRRGDFPRAVATTTPKPVALVRRLIRDPLVVKSEGTTGDNRWHLPESFIEAMAASYAGTRLGRQEIDGELIEDVEGSLWPRELIEGCRVGGMGTPNTVSPGLSKGTPNRVSPADLRRIVIGVDPPASAGDGADACGIVVCGLARDGVAYVLDDASVQGMRPEGWARAVARAAARWGADRVIAEANQGGAMVESVLRAADVTLPVKLVHASRGKSARAEPIATLYEQGKVRHVGAFPALEDEMTGMTIGGGYEGPGRSPDRADALVWALTELMLGRKARARVRVM